MAEPATITPPATRDATADALWTNWDIPPRTPTIPLVHVDGFDGPMDLLLDLAERQRFDLGRISILQLADQFVATMAALGTAVPLNRRADWLVMATRLVQLRSQTLLTDSPDALSQAAETIAAAEQQVAERLRMRAAADWLDRQPRLGRDVFIRPAPPGPAREADLLALLEGVLLVMDGPRQPPVLPERYRPALFRGWPVAEARARILALLEQRPGRSEPLSLLDCLPPAPAVDEDVPSRRALRRRAALSSVFCAALELAKDGISVMVPDPRIGMPGLRQRAQAPAVSADGT